MKSPETIQNTSQTPYSPLKGHERWIYPLMATGMMAGAAWFAYNKDYKNAAVTALAAVSVFKS